MEKQVKSTRGRLSSKGRLKKKNQAFKPVAFFKSAKAELKKVTWPTKTELVRMTSIVILISLIIGLYIGLLDYAFIKLTGLVL